MSSIDFTSFLKLMAHKKASDLFITAGVPPSIKVQGKVSPITQNPLTPQQSRDMVLNVMSPAQREEFEKTHECNFAIGAAGVGRFRVSCFYQRNQVGMVLRRIETKIPTIEELNLPMILKSLSMTKRGIIICVGATGTGKSTTLAAMIGYRNLNETGHLVFCTLHANNANQAIDRIINFFPEERRGQLLMDLSLNLKAIIAQQLVPTADGKERRVAMEILIGTPLVADYIRTGEVHKLKDVMKESTLLGMKTFDQSLFELYQAGEISYESALRFADSSHEVRLRIKLAQGGDASTLSQGLDGVEISANRSRRLPSAGLDQVGHALGDHDDRAVGVAADEFRHHRGVDHPQAAYAAHPALAVDHRIAVVVGAHLAGADRVVHRFRFFAHEGLEVGVGARGLAGEYFRPAVGVERRLRQQAARYFRRLDHHPQIEAVRVAEGSGLDARLVVHAVAGQVQAAAARRAQEAGVQGVARTGHAVPAVVIELRRHEMELDVRTRVLGQRGTPEAA